MVQNFKYSFKSLSCFDLSFFSSLCTFQGAFLAFPQPLRFRSASLYYQTSRFLSTAFLSFSQKYFPRPTSLLKVRPPLSRCSRSIYLFAVFCNYFFMNFICFIHVLYVELTRGTLYVVIFPRGNTSIQNKRRFRAAKKVLFNIYFFGLPERGHHFMQGRTHLFVVARFQCFPQNFNTPVKLVFRNRLVALNKNKFI